MLDIILETRIYDAGRFYQVGNYYSSLLSMFNASNTSLTSILYQKQKDGRGRHQKSTKHMKT